MLGGVLIIVLTWAFYTQHAWEDFYISYRASRNLALGHGLVFQPGERLHTFTSPLHTLLLAGLARIGGYQEEPQIVLWLYRVIGGLALGGAVTLVGLTARHLGFGRLAMAAAAGLVALDAKSLDFTVAGMETPLLLFFLALHLHALLCGTGWRVLAVAWAGLMWTRPDGFVFILASLAAAAVFGAPETRRTLLGRTLRAGAAGALLYAPWLIAATLYYGTPIPHTVVAKGLGMNQGGFVDALERILLSPWATLTTPGFLLRVYSATHIRSVGDWGPVIYHGARLLGLVAWLYWLNFRGGKPARLASFAFFCATFYGANAPFMYWYAPPYALLASLTWGGIVFDLSRLRAIRPESTVGRVVDIAVAASVAGLLLFQVHTNVQVARTMRWHQRIDETGNRQEIGQWLKAQAQPNDTVFLECVGYIGYYSGLKTHDYPGLTSAEMVAARRELGSNDYGQLIRRLQPDWLVLRPSEREVVKQSQPGLLARTPIVGAQYVLARVFDRSAELAAAPQVRGMRYLQYDNCFEIYRRQPLQPPAPTIAP